MTTNIISNTPESEKNEWRTPPEVFAWASSLIGGIDYDTACTLENRLADRIVGRYSLQDICKADALAVGWFGRCWCNPPYDNIEPWIAKALASKSAITAMLIPSPNGEARYAELCAKSHEIQIVGRLAFLKPDGRPVSGNTRGSSLFIINGYAQGSRSVITREEIWRQYAEHF